MVDFPHKVVVPQRPAYLVSRPRLIQQLQAVHERRLVTVSAPAGYGKTSLLVDFASASPALPICWYALDTSDQDQWTFLSYLAAAIEYQFPGATRQTAQLLKDQRDASFSMAVSTLTHDVYNIGRDFVLIIDDWHLVDGQAEIREIVSRLLLRCPQCHLLLASRSYPSLPNMMLLTARREMSSISEYQLRFTSEEAASVLSAEYAVSIQEPLIDTLVTQANGWITGILLSYQSPAVQYQPSPLLSTKSATEQQVYRFMAEQVLHFQPAEVQALLLDSALLEEFTLEQCLSILGHRDARRLLDFILQQHLFISETSPGRWRYHPMFREFLLEHYRSANPEGFRARSLDVAAAYAALGQWQMAFDQYIAADDQRAAQQVIAQSGNELFRNGRLETLERWFGMLNENELPAPLLCLYAQVMVRRGRYQEAQILAERAAARADASEEPAVLLVQAQVARITGRYSQALALAQQLLDVTDDPAERVMGHRITGICLLTQGDTHDAIESQKEALAIARSIGDLHAVAYVQRDLGLCYKAIGMLAAAEDCYTQAAAYWTATNNTGLRALSLNSIGSAQHLAGRYREAHETITSALRAVREVSLPSYESTILSCLGDLFSDLQLWARAQAAYSDARRLGGTAQLMSDLDIAHVQLLLRQREYDEARRALRNMPQSTLQTRAADVLLLRGQIACGLSQYEEAEEICRELFERVGEKRQPMDVARACLLQARVSAGLRPSDIDGLLRPLERAASIAQQLGHSAFLVPETFQMRGVLRRAAAAGWSTAEEWMRRQDDLLLATQALDQDDQRPLLVVRMFGVNEISLNGTPVQIGWQKAREVLYYLLSQPNGAPSDTLREAIWPDMGADRSRETLRAAVYQLRSVLPRDLIELHNRQIYRINRQAARIDSDVEKFLDLLSGSGDSPEALFEAIDLYRGPFLSTTDNQWCLAQRTHLEQRYLAALQSAAAWYEDQQMLLDALNLYQRVLAVNVFDELAHAGVMRCYIGLGNRSAAIGQYQTLSRLLDEELGLYPESSSEVEQLYRSLLAVP
ncbi:MAG TPA: tetratricopeptide repeat protein [Roseiflexaceae bacterium]|nr:tetratricopeptide repeat protein [Roseiflexaceae bacterium]